MGVKGAVHYHTGPGNPGRGSRNNDGEMAGKALDSWIFYLIRFSVDLCENRIQVDAR
jgi:hypothetical protein